MAHFSGVQHRIYIDKLAKNEPLQIDAGIPAHHHCLDYYETIINQVVVVTKREKNFGERILFSEKMEIMGFHSVFIYYVH
jgi:hypothetical protein